MKAAVVFKKGEMPKYTEDFAAPKQPEENELLISVKAAAVKNLDKMQASGKHYSTENETFTAKIVGGDGVGVLADGTRVYGIGKNGMIAEQAIIDKNMVVKLPDHLDDASAAALPNAVMGSAMALLFKANMQAGETVLINGATGVTGRIALQIAKHYGAKKIIATGRNEQSLKELLSLGADDIISLQDNEESFISQIKKIHHETPINIVIDYLWGQAAEMILTALKGKGMFTTPTRFITVGGMINDKITLSSSILRSTNLQISGSGIGSWTKDEINLLIKEILPEMFQLAADGKLKIETLTIPLQEVERAWTMNIDSGKRLVITI